jgi:prevent-host-death family protein
MRLGLREANQQFSKAIKAVRAGKQVVLTDRGQPIAVISPIAPVNDPGAAAVQAMADEGLVRPAVRKGPMPAAHWRAVRVKGVPLSQTIADDRDDTR